MRRTVVIRPGSFTGPCRAVQWIGLRLPLSSHTYAGSLGAFGQRERLATRRTGDSGRPGMMNQVRLGSCSGGGGLVVTRFIWWRSSPRRGLSGSGLNAGFSPLPFLSVGIALHEARGRQAGPLHQTLAAGSD